MKKMNMKNFKGSPGNLFLVALFFLAILFALSYLTQFTQQQNKISYSDFMNLAEQDQIKEVRVTGTDVRGLMKNNQLFETVIPHQATIDKLPKDVKISITSQGSDFSFWHMLLLLSFVLTPLVVWYFLRQARGGGSGSGGGNIFNMSKSKAKMFLPSQIKVKFSSVAGAVEAKEELYDIVDFLKNPDKYRQLGAKLTHGVLLVGEPGNGKTLLAKAVAGEANCPFFSISGSDFMEVFVGVGAARVRDLFAQARKNSPSIIFIDEIDAVGRQRGTGMGGGHDEREQTLNQLLTEMDGFEGHQQPVVVIAATNRPDVLDKALLRPGRFDRQVVVPYPDLTSREEILKVHAQGVKVDPTIDFKKIAQASSGFTGADLANLINEAAINASKHNQSLVTIADFDEARDKMILGKERKTMILTAEEKKVTAFHESGHALVTLLMPEYLDPLYKVTIVPRGQALGVTHSMPERDQHTRSKEELEARVMMMLGGRAAEEIVFKKLETGAASDFQKATDVVRAMVCVYGMSERLGMVNYEKRYGSYEYSEHTAQLIDEEVRIIIDGCYARTKKLLVDNQGMLDTLALSLLEKETLFPDEIYTLLNLPPRQSFKIQ